MRNVGGVAQTEAQKSSDLFMKTQYLDELTGGRGTVFATGTPISNSMVELYTIQRYLQYSSLLRYGLQHFDAWASTFGETVTAIEITRNLQTPYKQSAPTNTEVSLCAFEFVSFSYLRRFSRVLCVRRYAYTMSTNRFQLAFKNIFYSRCNVYHN